MTRIRHRGYDLNMSGRWRDLGFEVHALADFNSCARRQGGVHCINEDLRRGERRPPAHWTA